MEKELMEAVAEKAKHDKAALAEMLVEWVNPGHITTDFVGMLLNTRTLNPGDMLVKKVRKGIRVFTMVPGSIPLKSEITISERANYVLDMLQTSVTANRWELDAGQIGTVESIRTEMEAKLRDAIMGKVFTALSTVWTAANTANNFTSVGGSVTKTAMDNAINYINKTTSGVKAIVGSRAALTPMMDFVGWSTYDSTDAMSETVRNQYLQTGWVGSYLGNPVVTIEQEYNNPEDYTKFIPEDKILVIGKNVGEFINFGAPQSQEYTEMKMVPAQWNLTIYQQLGLLVDNADGIYVIGGLS